MAVRVVEETGSEEVVRERLRLVGVDMPPERQTEPSYPVQAKPPTRAMMMEVMTSLTRVLGFRLQLLLAFFGAAGLGGVAVYEQTTASLVAAVVYDALVFLPVLWVAYKRG